MKELREHKEIEITKTKKKLSSYTDSALVEDKIVINIMAMKQVFLVFLLFKSRRRRSTSSRGQGGGEGHLFDIIA